MRRELAIDGRYDVVIAISVFTHFNPLDFPAWLARLMRLLTPRGILVFTVNDERTLLPGRALDSTGAWFEPASENERLDPRRYGSTWVSESFVARALQEAAAAPVEYRRVPRGLWASQDVYVVAAPGSAALPEPLPLALEPAGALEEAAVRADGAIVLRGWATMPDGAPVENVTALLDGRAAAVTVPDLPRHDVAARFAPTAEDAARARPAWQLVLEPPPGGLSLGAVLTLTATSGEAQARPASTSRCSTNRWPTCWSTCAPSHSTVASRTSNTRCGAATSTSAATRRSRARCGGACAIATSSSSSSRASFWSAASGSCATVGGP